ncbi:hypothetical protein [Catellatospora aurea]
MEVKSRTVANALSTAALGATLAAALYVSKPTTLTMVAQEDIRIDRLAYSDATGFVAERHGDLISAGESELVLGEGVYHFRSTSDVTLVRGDGVDVIVPQEKDAWPDPPVAPTIWSSVSPEAWAKHSEAFSTKGSGDYGPRPVLTVITEVEAN